VPFKYLTFYKKRNKFKFVIIFKIIECVHHYYYFDCPFFRLLQAKKILHLNDYLLTNFDFPEGFTT